VKRTDLKLPDGAEAFCYGANSLVNAVDANQIPWRDNDGIITLHWKGKFRGRQKKGVQIGLPIMVPLTEQDAEARKETNANLDIALITAIIAEPKGTQRDWARAIGKAVSAVSCQLTKLKSQKLVDQSLGRWKVTKRHRHPQSYRSAALNLVSGDLEQTWNMNSSKPLISLCSNGKAGWKKARFVPCSNLPPSYRRVGLERVEPNAGKQCALLARVQTADTAAQAYAGARARRNQLAWNPFVDTHH
jgi:hypothetical protein